MTVLLGSNELKEAYLGSSSIKEIRTGSHKVFPKGYEPSAYTILYYPLLTNTNDESWNWNNGTIRWSSSFSNAAIFRANWRIDSITNLPSSYTISLWIKTYTYNNSEKVIRAKRFAPWYSANNIQRVGLIIDASNNLKLYRWIDSSSHERRTIQTLTVNTVYNIIVTYSWGNVYIYVNWVYKTWFQSGYSNNTNAWLGIGWRYAQNDSSYSNRFNLYADMKEFIVENRYWNGTRITDYYNDFSSIITF